MKKLTLKVIGYDTKQKLVSVGDEIAFEVREDSGPVFNGACKNCRWWGESDLNFDAPKGSAALRECRSPSIQYIDDSTLDLAPKCGTAAYWDYEGYAAIFATTASFCCSSFESRSDHES